MTQVSSRILLAGSCLIFALHCNAVSFAGPDADLEQLVAQYASIDSVHMTAIIEARFYADDPNQPLEVAGQRLDGEYRYWAKGTKYRIVSSIDPDTFPWMNNEVAFDGQMFQLLRKDRGVLSFGHGDRSVGTAVLPNPFFAAVSFLYPQDDDTWDRTIQLQDLDLNAEVAATISSVNWISQQIKNREMDSAVFPGAFLDGEPYTIRLAADTTSRRQPLRLDFMAVDTGRTIATIQMSHFATADMGSSPEQRWPRVIEYSAYSPNGDPIASLKYIITRLEINQEYDDNRFWINVAEADVLWSDDLQMFATTGCGDSNVGHRDSDESINRTLQEPDRKEADADLSELENSKSIRTVSGLLAVWREYSDETLQQTALEVVFSGEDDSDARLRIFSLSEAAFIALDEQEYNRQQREHLDRGQELLQLARKLLQIAQAREAAGNADEASALCEAVHAIGKANSDASLSRLAQSFGNAVITLHRESCRD